MRPTPAQTERKEESVQPSEESGEAQASSGIKIVQMLRDVRDQARRDIDTTHNPKAQALLKATAEVVGGLIKAYEDFEKGQERAWQ